MSVVETDCLHSMVKMGLNGECCRTCDCLHSMVKMGLNGECCRTCDCLHYMTKVAGFSSEYCRHCA